MRKEEKVELEPCGAPKPKRVQQDRFGEVNTPEFLRRLLTPGAEAEKAYRYLVEATYGPIMSYARRFISSQEEAQEVLQEVYLGVYKGISQFEGKSKLTTWIYGMAHYKICDRLSDRFRQHEELLENHKPNPTPSALSSELVKSTAWELPPDKHLLQETLSEFLNEAIESLPDQAKEIYYLRDVKGLSGEDVATILGISLTTVRVRLHRSRNLIVSLVKKKMKTSGLRQHLDTKDKA